MTGPPSAAQTGEVSPPPGGDPGAPIQEAVEEVLRLAATWLAWDGRPRVGDGSAFTPHKALRRAADHLIDHLAEAAARVTGAAPVPDTWLGRTVTLDADWAHFTEADLNEARNRLSRLAQLWRILLGSLSAEQLDRRDGPAWTLREVAAHAAGVVWYARQVGDLALHTGEVFPPR